MSNAAKTAVFYSNAANDKGLATARRIASVFERCGWNVKLCEYPQDPHPDGADMLVTFGGDGTILHAAARAAAAGVPILGINMGGKGFIAELEPDDTELIMKAAEGGFDIETRMMIDAEVKRGSKTIYSNYALNDVIIKGDNKVIEMAVFADGQEITGFSGDGIIIATPTGSTAYSMSAGGPIVEPSAKNIIITPICAHILSAKSFVLTAGRVVAVKLNSRKDSPAYLAVDGGERIGIKNGDVIRISKSGKSTGLVRLSGQSFYRRLSDKLTAKL